MWLTPPKVWQKVAASLAAPIVAFVVFTVLLGASGGQLNRSAFQFALFSILVPWLLAIWWPKATIRQVVLAALSGTAVGVVLFVLLFLLGPAAMFANIGATWLIYYAMLGLPTLVTWSVVRS